MLLPIPDYPCFSIKKEGRPFIDSCFLPLPSFPFPSCENVPLPYIQSTLKFGYLVFFFLYYSETSLQFGTSALGCADHVLRGGNGSGVIVIILLLFHGDAILRGKKSQRIDGSINCAIKTP